MLSLPQDVRVTAAEFCGIARVSPAEEGEPRRRGCVGNSPRLSQLSVSRNPM